MLGAPLALFGTGDRLEIVLLTVPRPARRHLPAPVVEIRFRDAAPGLLPGRRENRGQRLGVCRRQTVRERTRERRQRQAEDGKVGYCDSIFHLISPPCLAFSLTLVLKEPGRTSDGDRPTRQSA